MKGVTTSTEGYREFLLAKRAIAVEAGPVGAIGAMNQALFPHQRDICRWAIRGGNRAIFSSFGTGKTFMQLQ